MDLLTLNEEQQKIYNLVLNSKKSGITKSNLAKHSGMNSKEVEKIIKSLENRDKIKSVRPNGKTTGIKLWIDFNQTLESSLKTNAFRNEDTGIDEDLIQKLQQKMIYFLQQQNDNKCSLNELRRIYKSLQGDDESDFQLLINVMKFDSILIEEGDEIMKLNPFRMNQFQFYTTYLPCQTCPVYKQCRPGGTISPENCVFKW